MSRTVPEIYTAKYWQSDNVSVALGQRDILNQAFFILTIETAFKIARFLSDKKVVEVFAGTGFLAHHLRALSGLSRQDYKAYDNYVENYPARPGKRCRYPGVTVKNAFMAPIKNADVVIMTWPDPLSPNAAKIANKMVSGQYLLYNGETHHGCCANDNFFDILDKDFTVNNHWTSQFNQDHVNFDMLNDRWVLYRKN